MPVVQRPADVVGALRTVGERVRPVALARERTLPVHPLLAPLLPDGGLHRGSVVGCDGAGSLSLGLALVAEATRAGAWAGVVGIPTLGIPAAIEWGVAMERVFLVAAPPAEHRVAVLAAVADGAEVVVATGAGVRAGDARRLVARVGARGGVLVVVGPSGEFTPDVVCRVTGAQWEGLSVGAGRLTARRATVESSGRRVGRPRRIELWFPGPTGAPAPVDPAHVPVRAPVPTSVPAPADALVNDERSDAARRSRVGAA